MRCPECTTRNSVAARSCKACGHKFKRKPIPLSVKIGAGVLGALLVVGIASATLIPTITDPQANLHRIAKTVAAGTKSSDEARSQLAELDQAMKEYLKKFGNLDSKVLAQRLQDELASNAFEVHTFQFPRGLTLIELDTSLQARDYLTMKTTSGIKVFPVSGMEVFDNGRIMGETAGPVLVLIGHTSGLSARKPLVKVMSLLPDEVVDQSDKIVPELKGEGAAMFAKNERDVLINQSLYSIGIANGLFNEAPQAASLVEDESLHYILEWKDGHYQVKKDFGTSPLATLYAVAACMKNPDQQKEFQKYLGDAGEKLVADGKLQDGQKEIRFVITPGGASKGKSSRHRGASDTYKLQGLNGTFEVKLAKNTPNDAPAYWSVASSQVLAKPGNAASQSASKPPEPAQPEEKPAPEEKTAEASPPAVKPTEKPAETKGVSPPGSAGVPPAVTKQPEKVAITPPTVTPVKPEPKPEPKPAVESTPDPDSNRQGVVKYINADKVRVRSGPGTNFAPVGEVSRGSGVQVLSKSHGWYKVKNNGQIGYIYWTFFDFNHPGSRSSVTKPKHQHTEAKVEEPPMVP